jgi:hypothetical protein
MCASIDCGRDQPDFEHDSAGYFKARQKYLSPPGRSNMLYLVTGTEQEVESRAYTGVRRNCSGTGAGTDSVQTTYFHGP